MSMHFFMEFVKKATGLKLTMNVCSIWPLAQISDDFYYLDIWQCGIYFVAALFKELALISIIEMWGLESRSRTSRSRPRSRLSWQTLGLVSKFEPGLGLGVGGYGLDYITESEVSRSTIYMRSARKVCRKWWDGFWTQTITEIPTKI